MKRSRSGCARSGAVKRRKSSRSKYARRVPRNIPIPSIDVTRKWWARNWVPSTAAVGNFWTYEAPRIIDMPDFNQYSAIFDEYKVRAVKYTFMPKWSSFDGANTTDTTLPGITNASSTYLHILVDPTSSVVPAGSYNSTTLNSFLENGDAKTHYGDKPINVYYKPKVGTTLGAGFDNAKRIDAGWNNCSSGNAIAMNGFHVFAQDQNFTGIFSQTYDVFVTLYVSFRGIK